MSSDQFCQNCGLDFQRLSVEEEARYAQDPGYCPNCAYPLAGNYPPPPPPAPHVWHEPSNTMPPTRSKQHRNVLITILSLLLVIVGLLVLLASCDLITPGLLGQHPTPTATANGGSLPNQGNGTTATGGAQTSAAAQTATASGSGGGATSPTATSGTSSGGTGGPSPTPVPGSGGSGGNPTATPAPPVVVTISPMATTVQCGNTTTIVMTNPSSTQVANWTAHAVAAPPYTLSAAQGTIAPHGTKTITVSNIKAPLGTVIVTSGGLPQTVTITCTLVP